MVARKYEGAPPAPQQQHTHAVPHVCMARSTVFELIWILCQLRSRLRFRAPEPLPLVDRQLIDNAIRAVTNARAEMQLAVRGRS